MDVHDVENFIRYEFNDKALLAAAFIPSKNGRLGFLGDKVIGLILLDDWYRTRTNCLQGSQQLERYASNITMAAEARRAHFNQVNPPGSRRRQQLGTHGLATEVEAVVGAVWVDSNRNWDVTKRCYERIKA